MGTDLGNLDGDGDLDAFVANYGRPSQVWVNDPLDFLYLPLIRKQQ